MHISAMPPGEVPSTRVAGLSPVSPARAAANRALATIMPTVPSATAASQRGAARTKSGVNRTPSATPMKSWPALDKGLGKAVSCTSKAVSAMDTSSEPSTQGLGPPRARTPAMPRAVSAISCSKPSSRNSDAPGRLRSVPCTPDHCRANGMVITTSMSRNEWLAATRSTRAPRRSAIRAISEAPPMAAAKKAVSRFMPGCAPWAHHSQR